MPRLALVIERHDALGPELFLLRNQQHRLHLIVGRLLVLPECPGRLQPLLERHLFPQP